MSFLTNPMNDNSLQEDRRHVFDCLGRKVAVDNEMCNARCSEGNLEDYVRDSWGYSGAPHGLTETHKDKLNADLLSFLTARDGVSQET